MRKDGISESGPEKFWGQSATLRTLAMKYKRDTMGNEIDKKFVKDSLIHCYLIVALLFNSP